MPRFESKNAVSPRPRKFPPEVLTDAEVRLLLDACGRYGWTALRHRALIGLIYRSGLRIGEAIGVCPKDINFAEGSIRVLRAKYGHVRTVGIDPGATDLVQDWLAARASIGAGDADPLFCTASGKSLSTAFVRRLMPALAKKAGIAKRVHAHGFRHTHAAQLRAEGVDIAVISRQLGHANLLTTIRYLDHLAPEAVVRAIRARTWAAATTPPKP